MGFSRQLATTGFAHRATTLPDGRVVYRLVDGSGHVGMGADQWRELGDRFAEATRPVTRRVNRMSLALFPAVFVIGVTLAGFIPGGGLLILAGIFLGPIAIYLWQSARIQEISRAIEAELARLPRVPPPPRNPARAPRWLEIACMLLVGPGLIVQACGSLYPDAFRNTPLSGTHLDWKAAVALAILGGILFYRRWGGLPAAEPHVPENTPRRLDPIARARQR